MRFRHRRNFNALYPRGESGQGADVDNNPTLPELKGAAAEPGHLYLVATPIGNLGDISPRALALLQSCDAVACEDSRVTGQLLARFGIRAKQLIPFHEHNERHKAGDLAGELEAGRSLCLVSDAGTPALSDPGFRLVRECRRRGLPVLPVPGPNALVAALTASGLPTNAFWFAGFLPPKSAARIRFLDTNRDFPHTLCFYESPHRIVKFVDEIVATLGEDRVICLAKEITKLHERFLTGAAGTVRAEMDRVSLKGEFVVVIAPEGYRLEES